MANLRSLPPDRTGIARRTKEKSFLSTFVQVKGTIVSDQGSRLQRVSCGGELTRADVHKATLATRTDKHVRSPPLSRVGVVEPARCSARTRSGGSRPWPGATASLYCWRGPGRGDADLGREGRGAHGGGEAGDVGPVERFR
jgi:hypothetical protein